MTRIQLQQSISFSFQRILHRSASCLRRTDIHLLVRWRPGDIAIITMYSANERMYKTARVLRMNATHGISTSMISPAGEANTSIKTSFNNVQNSRSSDKDDPDRLLNCATTLRTNKQMRMVIMNWMAGGRTKTKEGIPVHEMVKATPYILFDKAFAENIEDQEHGHADVGSTTAGVVREAFFLNRCLMIQMMHNVIRMAMMTMTAPHEISIPITSNAVDPDHSSNDSSF